MKPAPFAYYRADDFAHAVNLLVKHGDGAKLLAGGQSLLPMMNLRLARPDVLVDLSQVRDGRHLLVRGDGLRIGALVRHAEVEHYPLDVPGFRWLPSVVRLIGHEPIRWRGTVGGSLAHADAAAEWCLLATLLDAQMEILGPRGSRTADATEFFQGVFTTSLESDEILVEIAFAHGRTNLAMSEVTRRVGDFASASCAVAANIVSGALGEVRVAFGGLSSTPFRCHQLEAALEGVGATDAAAGDLRDAVMRNVSDVADGDLSPYQLSLAGQTFADALSHCIEGETDT